MASTAVVPEESRRYEIADVLRDHAQRLRLSRPQERAVLDIVACRTERLGGAASLLCRAPTTRLAGRGRALRPCRQSRCSCLLDRTGSSGSSRRTRPYTASKSQRHPR